MPWQPGCWDEELPACRLPEGGAAGREFIKPVLTPIPGQKGGIAG